MPSDREKLRGMVLAEDKRTERFCWELITPPLIAANSSAYALFQKPVGRVQLLDVLRMSLPEPAVAG